MSQPPGGARQDGPPPRRAQGRGRARRVRRVPAAPSTRRARGTGGTPPPSAAVYRRRRLVVLVGLLVVVGLVLALLAWVWPGFARSDAGADPEPTVTVTADPPTPTLEPVARTGTTAFAQALPDSVLDLVLRSDSATDAWTAARALEAYQLEYADGEGDDATRVTVVAGQWPTSAEAEAAADDLVAAAGTPRTRATSRSPGRSRAGTP